MIHKLGMTLLVVCLLCTSFSLGQSSESKGNITEINLTADNGNMTKIELAVDGGNVTKANLTNSAAGFSQSLFEDDFSGDKGWISSPADKIYRDTNENNVHYSTDRGSIQVMYHSIPPITDDFKLKVDAMISSVQGNGFVYIGLTDDISDVPARWWEGTGIEIGYYAGSYYADVVGRYDDGTVFVSMNDDPTKDKRITLSANKWYTFELTKTGKTWKLDAYDENKILVKSVTDEFTGTFSPLNYVLFGNGDTSQWETADGKIDNLLISAPKGPIAIFIDVKPGSCPNPMNIKSKGVVPISIVGTEEFDVTTVDPKTVMLSREGITDTVLPIRWNYDDIAAPFIGELCGCHGLDGDGYMDMMLQFDTQELATKLKLDELRGGTVPVTISGKLKEENGGTPFKGQDCIKILR